VLAIVRKLGDWYAACDEFYVSPAVKGMHRNGTRKRDRFLSDEEIRALWSACSGLGTYGALVKVLLLTGQRRAKWLA
jgi:integrase